MKAYQLHEDENGWRGFIYDKDSCSEGVKKVFQGVPTKEKHDRETVNEAKDTLRTVITSNEKDFIRFSLEAQNRSIFPRCEDCWGLVIIPNADLQRQYAFTKAKIHKGVQIGSLRLAWKAAMWANLCVKITSEGTMVRCDRDNICRHSCQ